MDNFWIVFLIVDLLLVITLSYLRKYKGDKIAGLLVKHVKVITRILEVVSILTIIIAIYIIGGLKWN
jgi:hypothetical protein